MKSLTTVFLLLAALAPTLLGQNQQQNFRPIPNKKPVFRDVADHAKIAEMTKRAVDPMKKLTVVENDKDPTKENQPENLLEQSDIICFNGFATLVPKRAIISAPKKYEDRYKLAKGAKFLSFQDFFIKNRGWITNLEVTRKQAEGYNTFDEKTTEFIQESGNLIVATFRGGPISVLPPKDPEDAEDGEEAEDAENQEANKPKITEPNKP